MQALIQWVLNHEAALGVAGVAVLDLIFALVPSWQSNGILHFVLVQLQKLAGHQEPPK
jgi:hypothetical protein